MAMERRLIRCNNAAKHWIGYRRIEGRMRQSYIMGFAHNQDSPCTPPFEIIYTCSFLHVDGHFNFGVLYCA